MTQDDSPLPEQSCIDRRTLLKGALTTSLLAGVGSSPVAGRAIGRDANVGAPGAGAIDWGGSLTETKLTASDGDATDLFGGSVAVDGDRAVVGARQDEDPNGDRAGSAYVFERSGGTWTESAKLVASDGDGGDHFGLSVAIDADTVVVGAGRDEDPNGNEAGSAYVFRRSGGTWSEEAKLAASDGDSGDEFGRDVAIDGDTAVVGAHWDEDPSGNEAGSVYVFTRSGGTWSEAAKLVASDGDSRDNFGNHVAIDGDTIVVGAGRDEDTGGFRTGSAYVFERSGGSWTETTKLAASDGDSSDKFGQVAIAGDTIVVGAHDDEDPNGFDGGSAYVFTRSSGTWSEQAKLVASDGDGGDHFGFAVAATGDTALIGARNDEDPNGNRAGSAYVYTRSDGTWTEQAKLAASDGEPAARFGQTVAIDGDTAVAGAGPDDNQNGSAAGAAYVYTPANERPSAAFEIVTDPPVAGVPVTFDASDSADPDGSIASYEWDFDDDGTFEQASGDPVAHHTFDTGGEKTVTLRVTDGDGATDTVQRTFTVWVRAEIDVKPCSRPNAINPDGKGVVPVALKQTATFDPVSSVAVDTLRFGAPDEVASGGGSVPAHAGHVEDVVPCEGDGSDDLVVHFQPDGMGFDGDEETGRLEGETVDGTPLFGEDDVKLVGGDGGNGGKGGGNGANGGNAGNRGR